MFSLGLRMTPRRGEISSSVRERVLFGLSSAAVVSSTVKSKLSKRAPTTISNQSVTAISFWTKAEKTERSASSSSFTSTSKLFVVVSPAAFTPTPFRMLIGRSAAKVSTSSCDVSKNVLNRSLLFVVSIYSRPPTIVWPMLPVSNSPTRFPESVKLWRCVVSTYPSRSTVAIPPNSSLAALNPTGNRF